MKNITNNRILRRALQTAAFLLLLIIVLQCVWHFQDPPVFRSSYARVLFSEEGQLLSARVADDEQWRFPEIQRCPDKFKQCILTFEDQRFYQHWGIDPLAVVRAFRQNLHSGQIVSGASTISMQLSRLMNPKERSWWNKMKESWKALQLESVYSKEEILALYVSHAPFGGNVVGLSAASWRYFGIPPDQLSWGQAASLAVLPNAPSVIHPGKNDSLFLHKRNNLLTDLLKNECIDSLIWKSARSEPLPLRPLPLEDLAPHALAYVSSASQVSGAFQTHLDASLQKSVRQLLSNHQKRLKGLGVHNAAVLICETKTGAILAYHGNYATLEAEHAPWVDHVQSYRSSGSILKPFLYSHMIDEGLMMPKQWLQDQPMSFQSFRPENFHKGYAGMVAADEALQKSLNLPFVYLLQQYGYAKFYDQLKKWGVRSLNRSAEHYGLSLILGGAEVSLFDMVNAYRTMGHLTTFYTENSAEQPEFLGPIHLLQKEDSLRQTPHTPWIGAGAISLTLRALSQLQRPNQFSNWKKFDQMGSYAWKTGTSIGFRDAWAIATSPEFTIGIWVGNSDGEGKYGLTGFEAAAPILFDVSRLLPVQIQFELAYDDLIQKEVCSITQYPAQRFCPRDTQWVPRAPSYTLSCPHHQTLWLNEENQRVNRNCCKNDIRQDTALFVSPETAFYLKKKRPELPYAAEWSKECMPEGDPMAWIYPKKASQLILYRDENGATSPLLFELHHLNPKEEILWHINGSYYKKTFEPHRITVSPSTDLIRVSAIDESGHSLNAQFSIIHPTHSSSN